MGILKKWNLSLVLLSFGLTIFGTFLTRSGIISSVHAFVQNKTFTVSFALFLLGALTYGFCLIAMNRRMLSSDKSIESIPLLSRPSTLLFTCLILIAMAFITLWGTIFPLVSEAIVGQKLSFNVSFYNTINAPLAWALMFILGAGFLLPAPNTPPKKGFPQFIGAIIFGLALSGVLRIALNIKAIEFFLGTSLAGFAMAALWVYTLSPNFRSAISPRRLGALFVHIGLLIALLGIFGQYGHDKQEVSLKKGDSVKIGQANLHFEGLTFKQNGPWITISSLLHLYEYGKFQASLIPSKTFLKNQEQPVTRVAIQSSPKGDFYAVLAGYDFSKQQGVFELHHNPLIVFLWIGGALMGLGCLLAIFPWVPAKSQEPSGFKPATLGRS
jgi:cytochrome c-type biogenesis protein CcmF